MGLFKRIQRHIGKRRHISSAQAQTQDDQTLQSTQDQTSRNTTTQSNTRGSAFTDRSSSSWFTSFPVPQSNTTQSSSSSPSDMPSFTIFFNTTAQSSRSGLLCWSGVKSQSRDIRQRLEHIASSRARSDGSNTYSSAAYVEESAGTTRIVSELTLRGEEPTMTLSRLSGDMCWTATGVEFDSSVGEVLRRELLSTAESFSTASWTTLTASFDAKGELRISEDTNISHLTLPPENSCMTVTSQPDSTAASGSQSSTSSITDSEPPRTPSTPPTETETNSELGSTRPPASFRPSRGPPPRTDKYTFGRLSNSAGTLEQDKTQFSRLPNPKTAASRPDTAGTGSSYDPHTDNGHSEPPSHGNSTTKSTDPLGRPPLSSCLEGSKTGGGQTNSAATRRTGIVPTNEGPSLASPSTGVSGPDTLPEFSSTCGSNQTSIPGSDARQTSGSTYTMSRDSTTTNGWSGTRTMGSMERDIESVVKLTFGRKVFPVDSVSGFVTTRNGREVIEINTKRRNSPRNAVEVEVNETMLAKEGEGTVAVSRLWESFGSELSESDVGTLKARVEDTLASHPRLTTLTAKFDDWRNVLVSTDAGQCWTYKPTGDGGHVVVHEGYPFSRRTPGGR